MAMARKLRMRDGRYREALQVCESYLARNPAERSMLAAKGLLLHELGREAEARALVDLERFVHTRAVAAPAGFADLGAFNRALTAHVRAQSDTRSLPVIMVTSLATEKHREQATAAGVDHYFTKPYSEHELLEKIHALYPSSAGDLSS